MAEPDHSVPRGRMVANIRFQAVACREMGSPLYAHLLDRLADDVLAGGPGAEVLAGHEQDPGPSALALRLMGGVHRLVLEGRAPGLAPFYPSVGGGLPVDGSWPALRAVLAEHHEALRALIRQPPQTNEVGRAAALIGGLCHVVAWRPVPLRLNEIGASAGLNLRADRFRVQLTDGRGIGPVDSPVVLDDAWKGDPPPFDEPLDVVERAGCDMAPVDPLTEDGRLQVTSYVWPDQSDRLARLRGAFTVAAQVPATVTHESALDFVRRLELAPGTTTVLWHSVMWQYLDRAERVDVLSRIEELGERADAASGLAHLLLEPRRRSPESEIDMLLVLRTWPGGAERVLATAHGHGVPTTWE